MTTTAQAGASAPAAGPVVTAPGIYEMTADEYHRDPVPGGSLSSSGARKLLAPSCPAIYRWERDHGQAPRKTFDIGHAAHKLVLGDGPDLVPLDYADWRTKAAREERDAIRADGAVPLLRGDYEQVQAMADAIRRHPIAGPLFTPGTGEAEVSGFWQDAPSGIWRRFRADWIKHPTNSGRRVLADYKTTTNASLEAIARAITEHGYHQQAAWYLDGAIHLDLGGPDAVMVFVFQEKTAPYLVTVVELTRDDLRRGRERNRRAIDTYARCTATGHWPGHSEQVELISQPLWAQLRHDEEYS